MIHTRNKRDLVELISSIKNPGPAVKHALQVRSAWSAGDYHTFFKLDGSILGKREISFIFKAM
jgi:hypothetical protein